MDNAGHGMDVARIARLARLRLTDAEARALPDEMARIIAFADALPALDGVPDADADRPRAGLASLREDAIVAPLPRQDALAAAPAHEDGFITVPGMRLGEDNDG